VRNKLKKNYLVSETEPGHSCEETNAFTVKDTGKLLYHNVCE